MDSSGAAPESPESSGSTPDRILDAAERAFARAGFSGARVGAIADEVGIRRPSLLYHFPTKTLLYQATVARCFQRLHRALLAAMQAQVPFEERLSATVRTFTQFLEREPSVAAIVLRELLDGQDVGRSIVLEQIRPVVDVVEMFALREGAGIIRADLPVRQAIMQIASDVLLRAAAGDARQPLWGTGDHAEQLARLLFLAGGHDHVERR